MAKTVETISIRAYANKIGVSDKAVRNAIADGKIKKGVSYVAKVIKGKVVQVPQIIEAVADKEFGHLKKTAKPGAGVSKAKVAEKLEKKTADKKPLSKKEATKEKEPDDLPVEITDRSYTELLQMIKIDETLSYGEVTRRREILGAAHDKMKLQQLQGVLVEKDVIDKLMHAKGSEIKTTLLNIPSRVISLIRSSPNDIDAINLLTMEINQALDSLTTL